MTKAQASKERELLLSQVIKNFNLDNPDVDATFADALNWIRQQTEWEMKHYPDGFGLLGFPGIVAKCVAKSNRIWSSLIRGIHAKDKLDEEIEDNLMSALYAFMYYRMLTGKAGWTLNQKH